MGLIKTLFLGIILCFSINAAESLKSDERAVCQVNVPYGHMVPGGRCYSSGEVMTGIQSLNPLMIYCSRLTVQCQREEGAAEDIAKQLNSIPESVEKN